jgi:hypothetical protein
MDMSGEDLRFAPLLIGGDVLERMERAVRRVRERFHRCGSSRGDDAFGHAGRLLSDEAACSSQTGPSRNSAG